MRSPSLVVTRVLWGEDSWQRWSSMCEKHVFSCVGSDWKWSITTDGTARGFQYDEGKSCFVFCFPNPPCNSRPWVLVTNKIKGLIRLLLTRTGTYLFFLLNLFAYLVCMVFGPTKTHTYDFLYLNTYTCMYRFTIGIVKPIQIIFMAFSVPYYNPYS